VLCVMLGAVRACELPAGADSAEVLSPAVDAAVFTGAALAADVAAFGAALLLCVAPIDCMPPANM